MNPQIKTLLNEAGDISKKLRGKLAELSAIQATLDSVNRNEVADQKELDALIASGDFDNTEHVKTVAEKNAKLQLYPAKRKQLEGDLATKDEALSTYISGAQNLLVRFGSECRAAVEKRIADLLKPYISEQHRIDALV